jgi:hypothetical protein
MHATNPQFLDSFRPWNPIVIDANADHGLAAAKCHPLIPTTAETRRNQCCKTDGKMPPAQLNLHLALHWVKLSCKVRVRLTSILVTWCAGGDW